MYRSNIFLKLFVEKNIQQCLKRVTKIGQAVRMLFFNQTIFHFFNHLTIMIQRIHTLSIYELNKLISLLIIMLVTFQFVNQQRTFI